MGSFTYATRIVMCQHCGAPLEASPAGGTVPCRYCGAQNHLRARVTGIAFSPGGPIPEPERLERLRRQDGVALPIPPSLAPLLAGGGIPDWKVNEAFATWQQCRGRAEQGALDAAEELLVLTLLLSNKLSSPTEATRLRSLLETGLDVFTLPRHRQMMLGALCRGACREGDVPGAEGWLSQCDPASDDLATDSNYRVSFALVRSFHGQFDEALRALGQDERQVPIHDSLDVAAGVLRANAWEKLGRLDVAVPQLTALMAKPGHRDAVAGALGNYPSLGLCAQARVHAESTAGQARAQAATASAGGGAGKIFKLVGLGLSAFGALSIGLGLAFSVAGAVSVDTSGKDGAWMLLPGLLPGLMVGGITGVTLLSVGLPFFFIGRHFERTAASAAQLQLEGRRCRGQIVGVERTGMTVNDVPQYRIAIRVFPTQGASYEASTVMLLPHHDLVRLTPGVEVPLRVAPNDPSKVALEQG